MISSLLQSPIGTLQLVAHDGALVRIAFAGRHQGELSLRPHDPLLAEASQQLRDYFAGRRQQFDLPLAAAGTAFQRQVWGALAEIPWGEQRSYRDIARAIGRETAARAVGAANGRNPLPIIVPCHRVLGSDGSLTGFAGGVTTKCWLLQHEGWRAAA